MDFELGIQQYRPASGRDESWNMRVGTVCEGIGFQTEGDRRGCYFKDKEWWNAVKMSFPQRDWKAHQT